MNTHINKRRINGAAEGAYIVLEAGPTHTGLDSAKELARMAQEAGADAVKYQYLYADRLLADKSVSMSYKYLERDADGAERFVECSESLYDILRRRELQEGEWRELKEHCDRLGLPMISTVCFNDEVDFLVDGLSVAALKLASADINHLPFIRYCARRCAERDVNLQMDTGNADIWEIERAVIAAEEEGCRNIVIHLCPTGYPAHTESINLRMLPTLKKLFPDYAVAFSDHSPGWDMDIAAVALGADLIEKTITLDRCTRSCEHSFSLERQDAERFVQSIRSVETALGSSRRIIPAAEKNKRKRIRRSPYALRPLAAGMPIREEDFDFRRPEDGLSALDFEALLGRELQKTIETGEVLSHEHV